LNICAFISPSDNIKVKLKISGPKYIKNGVEYLKIDKVVVNLKLGKVVVNLENLFNVDKTLGNLGNELVNQNIQLLIDDVQPPIEQSLSKKIGNIINSIFSLAPFDSFFP